ncbi:MAG: short-chain dehydrogenase/reductase [Arthrobacter sp.]|nr:short-chain dehydrogenase/reductase [Arthrobacter sp.]
MIWPTRRDQGGSCIPAQPAAGTHPCQQFRGQRRHPADDFPRDDFDYVMNVNLRSVFVLCQTFGRPMLERRDGKIINVASLLSFQGGVRVPAYAASKGALAQLTKALCVQNWIGGSDHSPRGAIHVPPPPELVPELMENLNGLLQAPRHTHHVAGAGQTPQKDPRTRRSSRGCWNGLCSRPIALPTLPASPKAPSTPLSSGSPTPESSPRSPSQSAAAPGRRPKSSTRWTGSTTDWPTAGRPADFAGAGRPTCPRAGSRPTRGTPSPWRATPPGVSYALLSALGRTQSAIEA